MTPERWRTLEALVADALERPAPERDRVLAEARVDDELRALARELVQADAAAGDFLEQSAVSLVTAPRLGPRTIGPYVVERCLGSGGMGDVYLAHRDDNEFRRKVAVKVLAPGLYDTELVRRFRSERQILAGLAHPSIACLYEGGTLEDGRPYLVMEYVDGRPLHQFCEQRALSLDACIELFISICDAVEHAHRNLVLHLDIKPENILVTDDGVPKLLDFGIAKLLTEAGPLNPRITRTRARPLTPHYASPEQLRGHTLTTACDVYSLGVVLYRLLSGRLPYGAGGGTAEELIYALDELHDPRRPSAPPLEADLPTGPADRIEQRYAELRRRLVGDLDAIILKALRNEAEERYGSVTQMVDDLRRYRRSLPVHARRGTVRYRALKFVRRHRGALIAACVGIALLVGFSVAMMIQAARLEQQRAWAERERRRAEATSTFIVNLFTDVNLFARGQNIRKLTVGEVLDYGHLLLEHEYDRPEVDTSLRITLARLFQSVGELDVAERLLVEAQAERDTREGTVPLERAEIWHERGWVAYRRSDCEEARQWFERARAVRDQALSADEPAVTHTHIGLAVTTQCIEGYEHARPHYDRVIDRLSARAQTANEHRTVLMVRRQRAIARSISGDLLGALEDYEEIMAEYEALGLPPYPDQAELLVVVGTLYRRAGEPGLAIEALRRSRQLIREAHGGPHPREANAMIALARAHRAAGDPSAFERVLQQTLELILPALGSRHPDSQRAASWLRQLYREQGRSDELSALEARVELPAEEP